MNPTIRDHFGHDTTADEVLAGIDLTGKRVLITGASSGIGAETARAMAAKGAEVIMTARNMNKGESVAEGIRSSTGNPQVSVMFLELASFEKIRAFGQAFLSQYDRLDLQINNAGVMACPFGKTDDGFERQFGTNHLGHFLLTQVLTPALIKGAPSRVVNLSSRAHRMSPVVFDDLQFQNRDYHKWGSYGQSKTANILHAVELNRRLGPQGVQAFSVHPGVIQTELGRHLDAEDLQFMSTLTFKTTEAGAATSVYAATAPELAGKGGEYLFDCRIAEVSDDPDNIDVVRSYAVDSNLAQKLWTLSEEMVGG